MAAFVLNVVARDAAQNAVSRQVQSSTKAGSVTTRFTSQPFLWDALADGKLGGVTVTANDIPLGPIDVTQVQVVGHGVAFSRSQLFRSQKVHLTSVDSATVTVKTNLGILGAEAIRALHFTDISIIPPCSFDVAQVSDGYQLSCTVSPVPASVVNAINSGSA